MQEEDDLLSKPTAESKIQRSQRINIGVPNNEVLAYQEVLQHDRLALVRRTLKGSSVFRSILKTNSIGVDQRMLLDIFNYGFFNVIGSVNIDGGNDPPLSIAVISRPEELEEKRGVNPVEVTKADYEALRLLQERNRELEKKYGFEGFYNPVVETIGLDEIKDRNDKRMVIMHNEVVGREPLHEGGSWGSNEVNLVVWDIEGKEELLLILNDTTALNPFRFEPYYELCGRAWKIPAGELEEQDRNDLEELVRLSGVLKEGYVAALTSVWFLSGAVPENFDVNAGDGVLDGARETEIENKSVSNFLKLITVRGGLSHNPNLSGETRRMAESKFGFLSNFKKYLMLLSAKNLYPQNWHNDEKLVTGKEMLLFSQENIEHGMRLGLQRLLGKDANKILKKLQEDEPLVSIWHDLDLNWGTITTSVS